MSKITSWIKVFGKSEPAVIIGSGATVLYAVKQEVDASPTPVTWGTLWPLLLTIVVRFAVISPNTHAKRVRSEVSKAVIAAKATKKPLPRKTTAKAKK